MTLKECRPGTRTRLRHVRGPEAGVHRLAEMGFVRGAEVRVLHRGPFGGRVVALGSSRVAIDGATARLLEVEPGAAGAVA